jgi:hypothetical protein
MRGSCEYRHSQIAQGLLGAGVDFVEDTVARLLSKLRRKHQIKAIAYSGFLGWWGVPFGLIVTPYQLVRNGAGMLRRADRPSPEFVRAIRVHLAERIAAAQAR